MKRRLFVASSLAAALAGCDRVVNSINDSSAVHKVIDSAEKLNHVVIGTHGMAKLYRDSDITWDFPTNGLATPSDATYRALMDTRFASYRLPVGGLVEQPATFNLAQLRALTTINQVTRHDCVEGWSVIGRWAGVPLGSILKLVRPKPEARYVVFYSYDRDDDGSQFYGSLDLVQAAHPQTQLALDLNGKPIDPDHGGPVRLRIPTQLAYKSTKWVRRIELVSSFASIFQGKGGYWEDRGYEWYAGI